MSDYPSFTILATGPQALIEDRGRPGHAATGISASGHFDRLSAARANHAVGNTPDAPLIESLFGGLSFTTNCDTYMIATGVLATVSVRHADGTSKNHTTNDVIRLFAGDQVTLSAPEYGLRAYVAVRGGFDVPQVVGSSAFDVMSTLGPKPLSVGQQLAIETTGRFIHDPDWLPLVSHLVPLWKPTHHHILKVIPGPRDYWFTTEAIHNLFTQTFTVNSSSNRVGVRLQAAIPLQRRQERIGEELASEGMVRGCIQVPPDGNPVIFGPDHPVTGGYPVIGVLTSFSSDHSGQLQPGDTVQLKPQPAGRSQQAVGR